MKPDALICFGSLTARVELQRAFGAAGFEAIACGSVPEVRDLLGRRRYVDVMVVDPWLPEGGAGEVLAAVQAHQRPPALVLVDGEPESARGVLDRIPREDVVRFLGTDWDAPDVARTARDLLEDRLTGGSSASTVLAVDDSATFRAHLRDELAGSGFRVITAASGEECLSLLDREPVDAVLLDMIMHPLDGVETCRRIRADDRFRVLPVLMLTAVEGTEPLLAALQAGADDFVSKAGEPEILKARLRAHLRRKQYEDENRRMREALLRSELEVARERAAKDVAETRAHMVAQLEEAVRARDEFVSVASHELKTPLTSMLIHAQTLIAMSRADEAAVPLKIRSKLEVVERQVRRLNGLVLELLDIARITGGRLELRREKLDLSELARDVVDGLEEQVRSAGCEVRLRAAAPVEGEWDRARLEQVLANLLTNALKYAPREPIDVEVRRDDGFAELEVRDRGIGIPPEAQARIFERFERAVSVRQYGGFGLGLWISREIIEAHGGSIHVDSVPGEGATFRVRLPLVGGAG